MKKMKKVALLLVSVMLVSMLAGCGTSFDASGYLKAVLDNSYKNDSTDFVKMKVGTKEEAEKVYEQGIDTEMAGMAAEMEVPEDLEEDFRQTIKDLLKKVNYTVGEAEKQDDDSYVVTIKYKKLNAMTAAGQQFQQKVEEYTADLEKKAAASEEVPSEEEIGKEVVAMFMDSLNNALNDATYGEEETTTVKIELVNKVYTPNTSDVEKLETLLLDIDGLAE